MDKRSGTGPHNVVARGLRTLRRTIPMVTLALGLAVVSCRAQKAPAGQEAAGAVARPAADMPEVLATVGEVAITRADIRARIGDQLDQMEAQYGRARHRLIETALDSILSERILAAEAQKQGKTMDDLLAAEAGGSLEPTAVEISAWYSANQARLSGRTLEQLRPQISNMLREQRRKEALEKLQTRLYSQARVVVKLEPFRVSPGTQGAPAVGPENAPVTIVEFSDFQCPYCGALFPTLKKVETDFPKQVRLVFRQFPLTNLHPDAFKAAEASLCANQQGRFWEMHDRLFQDQKKLTVADLKAKATALGLDRQKFDSCLDSGHFVEQIQQDQKEGIRLGITGTPALFVNGSPMEGAVPYETLAAAIRKELERAARK